MDDIVVETIVVIAIDVVVVPLIIIDDVVDDSIFVVGVDVLTLVDTVDKVDDDDNVDDDDDRFADADVIVVDVDDEDNGEVVDIVTGVTGVVVDDVDVVAPASKFKKNKFKRENSKNIYTKVLVLPSKSSIINDCVAAPHVAPSKPPQLPSPMSGRNVTMPRPPVEQSHGSPLRLIA